MTTVQTRQAATRTQTPAKSTSSIPFMRLLHVEWRKATDTRSARLLLLAVTVTMGGVLMPLLQSDATQTESRYLNNSGVGLTLLLPVVTILLLTTEWTQRTVLTTFALEPRRGRVVRAKVTTSVILALMGSTLAGAAAFAAIQVARASGKTLHADLHTSRVAGFIVFAIVCALAGAAFGAVLHNTVGAIMMYFIMPSAFAFFAYRLGGVGEWIAPPQMMEWIQRGQWSGHIGQFIVATTIWVVVPLAAGMYRTVRREIK
jgi:ABC-2 type transport system permease protein